MNNYYRIGPGDTLSNIARAYGVTVAVLASMNNLADPNQIQAGQTIRVPATAPDITDSTGVDTPSPSPSNYPQPAVGTDANPLQLSPMTITGSAPFDWTALLKPPQVYYLAAALAAAAYLYTRRSR